MKNTEKFYITTPIFYPNADLHMGHAYTVIICDIVARYYRALDKEVYFLTGSDEHSLKVVRSAEKVGKTTHDFVDGIVVNFKNLFKSLDISYDQFIRTSDKEVHWPGALAFWQKLVDAGDIYKKSYKGLYCVGHEAFVTEKDLVNGLCPDHGSAPELIEEENYFFKLSKYAKQVEDLIESDALSIEPASRKGEILSFIRSGLQDVSFSRPTSKNDWSIPVPGDPVQSMYVWCDALTNYVSAIGYGRRDKESMKNFEKWWPADCHVIGKDILRFHAVFWPAMLISAGLPLPKKIFVHGMITSGGKKMSKTLGNVINPVDLVSEYGYEALRYYIAGEISTTEDGDMTVDSFKNAYNSALANGIGNLASRIMQMALNYGVDIEASKGRCAFDTISAEAHTPYRQAMEKFAINTATKYVWKKIADLDLFIQKTEPFKVFKTDPERARADVSHMLSELWVIARLLTPILPETSLRIEQAFNKKEKPTLFARK